MTDEDQSQVLAAAIARYTKYGDQGHGLITDEYETQIKEKIEEITPFYLEQLRKMTTPKSVVATVMDPQVDAQSWELAREFASLVNEATTPENLKKQGGA